MGPSKGLCGFDRMSTKPQKEDRVVRNLIRDPLVVRARRRAFWVLIILSETIESLTVAYLNILFLDKTGSYWDCVISFLYSLLLL
jgi:hypothetical protein